MDGLPSFAQVLLSAVELCLSFVQAGLFVVWGYVYGSSGRIGFVQGMLFWVEDLVVGG